MTHPNAQPGSHPEDRFDAWLDALVAGTPGDTASLVGNDGSLGRAISGARQLHGLAARTTPAGAAQRRIEEDLMRSGALAAPRGTTWIPTAKEARRAPWWAPTSSVLATAIAITVLVALVGSLVWSQRPVLTPGGTDDAPGLAGASPGTRVMLPAQDFASPMASPAVSPVAAGEPSGVVIVEGTAADARVEGDLATATLGDGGLTVPVDGGETVTVPNVRQVHYIGIHAPGMALVTRSDGTEAVVDLATGDVLHEVPAFRNWTRDFGPYRFVPIDDTLTAWTVADLRTGETRPLSDIVDLPGDTAVMPITTLEQFTGDTQVFQVELGSVEDLNWVVTDPAAQTFVIARSLDRAAPLPDYPTVRDNVGTTSLVASLDGATVAYETRAGDSRVIVLDVTSGRVLGRYSASEVGKDPALAGFTSHGRVILTDGTQVLKITPGDSGAVSVLTDGLEQPDNPLLHAATETLYVRDIDVLQRVDLTTGVVTEVTSGLLPAPFGFSTPGGGWIVVQTRDGHIMVDARTGEVVSRMNPDATWASGLLDEGHHPNWTDADGDTLIIALATTPAPPDREGADPAAWVLSPSHPEGLEVAGPEHTANFWLSPDGSTLYAWASERLDGPGTVWATPLGEELDWQPVAEGVGLAVPVMFDRSS